jgi:hypothetical protein
LFLLNFDENGHGTITLSSGSTMTLTGTLMADPTAPPGFPLVLTYLLPESVISGDVGVTEPGDGSSDGLRFTDAAGTLNGNFTGTGSRMIFYSDLPEPGEPADLADTGFPANLGAFGAVQEIGAEGNNSFDWRPIDPRGFPFNNEYIGISDAAAVTEPGSVTLLCSSMAVLALMIRQRHRQSITSRRFITLTHRG